MNTAAELREYFREYPDEKAEVAELYAIVARIIERRPGAPPAWIANEAMNECNPDKSAPPLVEFGCRNMLEKIARDLLEP